MRYYIADLHFYHSGLNNAMDNRGFASLEEMNAYMIDRWNSKVRKNDEVVILGDFSIGKGEATNEILARLNGRKFLIRGNHDYFLDDRKFNKSHFDWVESYKEMSDHRRKVVLCHYPIMNYNGQFRCNDKKIFNTYMLYGHVHNSFDEGLVNNYINSTKGVRASIKGFDEPVEIPVHLINCFCMFSDYVPLTLDEWIENDKKRRAAMNAGACHGGSPLSQG